MSWFWGKTEKVDVEENLTEEGTEVSDETLVEETSDRDETNDINVDVRHLRSGNNRSENETTNTAISYDDDQESSDESSFEDTSDSEEDGDFDDDDDDSLVVDLIESMSTEDEVTDDDISIVEEGTNARSDDSFESVSYDEDEATSAQSPYRGREDSTNGKPSNKVDQDISSTENKDDKSENQQSNADNADSDDPVASFWEKQSLLVLAAEHDRVDILKALIKDENEEKDALLNSGIPPLHLAISFGSVNTAQSLLRMGADPSVRPNIDEVLEQRKNQPEDSKVDIPNIRRFEKISAWELAFGNELYEKKATTKTSWSLFGSNASAESDDTDVANNRIIKPVDMAPSKREGIRHAFTAEALRSVGSDEVDRLKQLVYSGMPASIDIGGKDLYGWAVEMGALQCEEFLRPVEAAKYDEKDENSKDTTQSNGDKTPSTRENGDKDEQSTKHPEESRSSSSFVVHRPDEEETVPQLKNRLDELDSLAMALSVCLDNLAEEVSVCHGLLLMGGGASALASHVRSLRDSKAQKLSELEDARLECLDVERELTDLVHSTGDVGKEISKIANTNFLPGFPSINSDDGFSTGISVTETRADCDNDDDNLSGKEEIETEKISIKAQIAASENKIRKLRASIADLSEENTRDLKEVERRGLEGGINLVRGLREELRDLDFHLSEARSMKTACKAKINMILARVQKQDNRQPNVSGCYSDTVNGSMKPIVENSERSEVNTTSAVSDSIADTSREMAEDGIFETVSESKETPKQNDSAPPTGTRTPPPTDDSIGSKTIDDEDRTKIAASVKIATGDSQAIAIIQPGHKGFFTVDLWEVLLRIIGFERAANRRSVQNATRTTATTRSDVMTI